MYSMLNDKGASTLTIECVRLLNMSTLQQRLRDALAAKGKSQSELARACGITRGAVNQWLTGTTKALEGSNLTNAAKFLGVSPHWLATGEELTRDGALATGSSTHPSPIEQKPPTIPDEIWQSLPPKARALVEDIVHKSHEGKIKEEDLVLLLSTTDRLSQSDP